MSLAEFQLTRSGVNRDCVKATSFHFARLESISSDKSLYLKISEKSLVALDQD